MYQKVFKRLFDIIFSLLLMPFVLLIIVIFGLMIIVDDGFPIFYMSERRGFKGSVFKMFKLRSMKNNSPDIMNEDGSTYNSLSDPRQTKIGKLIRKLSVDEIPQIINVLLGHMSFIGPRPSIPSGNYQDLEANKQKRLEVLPGITGYSQAYYRNSISQAEKIEKDCWYVDNISFLVDVKIFFQTIKAVVFRKNIYNK